MNTDLTKILIGTIGTGFSFGLSNAESLVSIFAGAATGIFMLVSTIVKLKNKNKNNEK